MALTTRATLTTTVPTEFITARILDEARPFNIVAPLVYNDDQPMGAGRVYSRSQLPLITAATVLEASDVTATARTTSEGEVTIGEAVASTDLTDFAEETSKIDQWINRIAMSHGRAIAQKVTGDLCSLFPTLNSSTAVGTSGTNITIANFIEAIFTLSNNNAPGQKRAVLHPRQILDLMTAIAATTGTPFVNMAEVVRAGTFVDGDKLAGFIGVLFGVGVWETTEVTNVNSDVDRAGAMFVEDAMMFIQMRDLRTEFERDASARVTEIVTTATYGVGLGQATSTYGVPIETDDN